MSQELITEIFEVVLIPFLGVLVTFFVKWVNAKSASLQSEISNNTYNKYIELLNTTITNCVISTNQVYVNSLKEQGKFDREAQEIAFKKTQESVLNILNEEALLYLNSAFGDINEYITKRIEAEVHANKITVEK